MPVSWTIYSVSVSISGVTTRSAEDGALLFTRCSRWHVALTNQRFVLHTPYQREYNHRRVAPKRHIFMDGYSNA